MQALWLGVALFALGVGALVVGAAIEFDQRRQSGPIAFTPTLQYALMSGLLAAMGMATLRLAYPWIHGWCSPVAFVLALAFGIWLLGAVARHAETKRQR